MLHPSYSELMEVINGEADVDNRITSRYTIVIAASRRARQLIDRQKMVEGQPAMNITSGSDKAVSIAVEEMFRGKIKIKAYNDDTPVLDDELGDTYYENN